jgi:hypothetical protein
MWKHLIGLTATAPQFAEVDIHPKVHPDIGPSSSSGSYLSPRGTISSSWNLTGGGSGPSSSVLLSLSLPTGVEKATVTVPKPFEVTQLPSTTKCSEASEHGPHSGLVLSCPAGGKVQSIDWAAWGTPTVSGPCDTWVTNATCNANQTLIKSIVEKACLGESSCDVSFGGSGASALGDPCAGVFKTLAVKATCTASKSYAPATVATVSVGGAHLWDGKQLVGTHPGISSGTDVGDGVEFQVSNGAYEFEAKAATQVKF